MTEQQAHRYLLNRIIAIRDAVSKQEERRKVGLLGREMDVAWQLGRFIDEFEKVLGLPSSELETVIRGKSVQKLPDSFHSQDEG